MCHVTFSWNKNEIVNVAHNHNPHYYAYQRENNNGVAPRVPGDNPCGVNNLVRINLLTRQLQEDYTDEEFKSIREAHRSIWDIRDYILPRYPDNIGMQDNSDLRVQYLMEEIDEKEWIKVLQLRQKKAEKCRDMNLIITMYVDSLTDLFSNYYSERIPLLANMLNLRKYVNQQLTEVGRVYKNKSLRINKNWLLK